VSGHIVTYTGKAIEPLNPDPALIDIRDIAHALGNVARFCGHTRTLYTVAQHSVLVSRNVPPEHALVGLLHDASEAYLSDIARPIKQQPEFGTVYKAAEERLMHAIGEALGFDWPPPACVKRADEMLLRSEQRDLMPDLLRFEGDEYLPEPINPWPPEFAKFMFLCRYAAVREAVPA
jgi:uncharacterized protein